MKLKHITMPEVLTIALESLGTQVRRIRHSNNKAVRDKVEKLNPQRQEIALELYHEHRIQRDELYLIKRKWKP